MDEGFWDAPLVRAALESRHFGQVLKAYRAAHEPLLTQAEVGQWLGLTQGQVSRIERARVPVHDLEKLDHWARTLHIPEQLLWFQFAQPHDACDSAQSFPTVNRRHADEGSEVRRRDFLKVAGVTAGIAGTGIIADSPWQRVAAIVGGKHGVDAGSVQLLEDRTAEFFLTEETTPARQLLRQLSSHRATLNELLNKKFNDGLRSRLAISVGEADALAGWMFFDLGRHREAANAYRSALRIARESGDGPLAACALSYWSYLATLQGDTGPAVQMLTKAGEYVRGSAAPTTRAWVSARQAEELARMDDDTGALRALERALTAYDFATPNAERPWTAFFTPVRMSSLAVSTYTNMAHEDAEFEADKLLRQLTPVDNKVRAIALADLAAAAVQVQDFDKAHRHVSDSVALVNRSETSYARSRLLAIADNLSVDPTGGHEARSLVDQINSTLTV